ncbi:hypothetical protein [Morganella morganii]|uniref:hypothetical protein n=1 Tax=Morganella morganii TaxID=582 RepID=UPI00298E5948|nr:hypothetical protein [Morganella morganii]MDW7782310.1 hypothetical protein [Morganella morganii]MDW7791016.1 hypothetical protein [Morganella morganii]
MEIDFNEVKTKITFNYCDKEKKIIGCITYRYPDCNGVYKEMLFPEHWDQEYKPSEGELYRSRDVVEDQIASTVRSYLEESGMTTDDLS